MLKEKYSVIHFPIEKKDPKAVLRIYSQEFEISDLDESTLLIIFVHALRDYLIGKLDEDAFGSLSFALFTNEELTKKIKTKNSKLYGLLADCLDISWLSDGKYFPEFRKQLKIDLQELKRELK